MARGEFVLVDKPEHQPGVDFLTRSGVGPFVDTGIDVVRRGQPGLPFVTERVYLSVATIKSLAAVAGINSTETPEREETLIALGKAEFMKEGYGERIVELAGYFGRLSDAVDRARGSRTGE